MYKNMLHSLHITTSSQAHLLCVCKQTAYESNLKQEHNNGLKNLQLNLDISSFSASLRPDNAQKS